MPPINQNFKMTQDPMADLSSRHNTLINQNLSTTIDKTKAISINKLGNQLNIMTALAKSTLQIQSSSANGLKELNKNLIKILTTKSDKVETKERKTDKDLIDAIKSVGEKKNIAYSSQITSKSHDIEKDVNKEQKANIKSLRDLAEEQLDQLKLGNKAKAGGGLLAGLGMLLSMGGLLGYLFTGKQEFLFSLVKGLKHTGTGILKMLTAPIKIVKSITSVIDDVAKGAKIEAAIAKSSKMAGMFMSIGKFAKTLLTMNVGHAIEAVPKMFKGIKSMFSGIKSFGSMFKGLGGLLTGGIGSALKGVGKAGGKSALKKIPIIGSLLGIIFAISRFKKGDVTGGLLEIASGLTALVPGFGIPLGLAIDAVLLARDFKGVDVKQDPIKKAASKIWNKDNLKYLPVIGPIMGIIQSFKLWKTDKKKAILGFINAGLDFIPGFSVIRGIVNGAIDYFSDKKTDITPITTETITQQTSVSSIQPITTTSVTQPLTPVKPPISNSKPAKNVKDGDSNVLSSIFKPVQITPFISPLKINKTKNKKEPSIPYKLFEEVGKNGNISTGKASDYVNNIRKDKNKTFHISNYSNLGNVNEAFFKNFVGMATEYNQLTGRKLTIGDAYRSAETQQKAINDWAAVHGMESAMRRYAPPGLSMHQYGLAMDLGVEEGLKDPYTELHNAAGVDLISKWKMNFSALHKKDSPEPWHIEPTGLDYKSIVKSGTGSSIPPATTVGSGDSAINMNYANTTNANKELNLSKETINQLAIAITEGYKKAQPKPQAQSNMAGTALNARRL